MIQADSTFGLKKVSIFIKDSFFSVVHRGNYSKKLILMRNKFIKINNTIGNVTIIQTEKFGIDCKV